MSVARLFNGARARGAPPTHPCAPGAGRTAGAVRLEGTE